MQAINRTTLVAYVARDPELRFLSDETQVCVFAVATNDRRRAAAGNYLLFTTWFKIIATGDLAERAHKRLRKGNLVYVEGRLRVTEYFDKNEDLRCWIEVMADKVELIPRATAQEESEMGITQPAKSRARSGGAA